MISAQWLVRKFITYVLLSNYNKGVVDSLIFVSPGVSRVLKMAFQINRNSFTVAPGDFAALRLAFLHVNLRNVACGEFLDAFCFEWHDFFFYSCQTCWTRLQKHKSVAYTCSNCYVIKLCGYEIF